MLYSLAADYNLGSFNSAIQLFYIVNSEWSIVNIEMALYSPFTIHHSPCYSFSNSAFSIFLTSSIVSFSKSVLLSSSSGVSFSTLRPVSHPILFNSLIKHVSISSLNSSRSISNPSYTSSSASR